MEKKTMNDFKVFLDLPDGTTMEWPCTDKHHFRMVLAQIRNLAYSLRGELRAIDHTGKELLV